MSIVTKTGDDGTTGLFGGKRLPKSHARLHAYGTVDELNAVLGIVIAEEPSIDAIHQGIVRIQNELFRVGADLATPIEAPQKVHRITKEHTEGLESWVKEWESHLSELQNFILPGGSKRGALLHVARTVCRRAERWTVQLSKEEEINREVIRYLNRLSDLLFLLARAVNKDAGKVETKVEYL